MGAELRSEWPPGWLTVAEVARARGVTARQVQRWVKGGLRAVWVCAPTGRPLLAIDPDAAREFAPDPPGRKKKTTGENT